MAQEQRWFDSTHNQTTANCFAERMSGYINSSRILREKHSLDAHGNALIDTVEVAIIVVHTQWPGFTRPICNVLVVTPCRCGQIMI